jgi:hypothetical protein
MQKQTKLGRKWDLSKKGKAVSVFLGKLSNNDNEPRTIKPQPKLHSALRRHTATCASHGNRVSD